MKTRESKKQMYICNFTEEFNKILENTIFTEEGQEMWTKLKAENAYQNRKNDIENKADALMYGTLDGRNEANRINEKLKAAK